MEGQDQKDNVEVKAQTPPTVPQEVIEKIQKQAVEQAIAEATKVAGESTKQALQDQSKRVLQALGSGEVDAEAEAEKVLNNFVKDPVAVLQRVTEIAETRIEKKLQEQKAAEDKEKAAQVAINQAIVRTYEKRPDIQHNSSAREMLEVYFASTDPEQPAAERIAEAVRKYDLMMEKIDGKTAEERIKAVASLSSTSRANDPTKEKSASERIAEDHKNYIEERKQAYLKKVGKLPRNVTFS